MQTFTYVQSTASKTWSVAHNLNSRAETVEFTVLVNGKYVPITPISVERTSANVLTATFSTAISGTARVTAIVASGKQSDVAVNYTGFVAPVLRTIDYKNSPYDANRVYYNQTSFLNDGTK